MKTVEVLLKSGTKYSGLMACEDADMLDEEENYHDAIIIYPTIDSLIQLWIPKAEIESVG